MESQTLMEHSFEELCARLETPAGEDIARRLLPVLIEATHDRQFREIAGAFGLLCVTLGAVICTQEGNPPRDPKEARYIFDALLAPGKPGYAFQALGAALIAVADSVRE